MNSIKIWHNPRCSKSREAMSILEENNCKSEVVQYLENTPDAGEIKTTLGMLGLSARELMRTKEDIYKELNLKDESNEDKLVDAMVKNPKLIERPVLFKNGKAIIGRPTSIITNFINS
jgi:arsenate reductase